MPAACTFGGSDAACAVGDHAGTHVETFTRTATTFTTTTEMPFGVCAASGMPVISTWTML